MKYTIKDIKNEAKKHYTDTNQNLSEFIFIKMVELANKNIELEERIKELEK